MSVMVVYFILDIKVDTQVSNGTRYHQNIERRNERFGLNVFILIFEKPLGELSLITVSTVCQNVTYIIQANNTVLSSCCI